MANVSDYFGVGATVVSGSDNGANAPGNSLVIATKRVLFYNLSVYNPTAGDLYVMVFDAAAVPSNGTVSPKELIRVPSAREGTYQAAECGDRYVNGVVAVVSTTWGTAAGNYTLTLDTTNSCFFSGKVAPW